ESTPHADLSQFPNNLTANSQQSVQSPQLFNSTAGTAERPGGHTENVRRKAFSPRYFCGTPYRRGLHSTEVAPIYPGTTTALINGISPSFLPGVAELLHFPSCRARNSCPTGKRSR